MQPSGPYSTRLPFKCILSLSDVAQPEPSVDSEEMFRPKKELRMSSSKVTGQDLRLKSTVVESSEDFIRRFTIECFDLDFM